MSLATLACPGGVVLDWSVPQIAGLNHIQVLRGASAEIPTAYPPAEGVAAVGGASSTDPSKSDGFDRTADGGNAWYRAVAYDGEHRAIAASTSQAVRRVGVASLGALGVVGGVPGSGELTFDWTSFGGSGDCFTYYKLVASKEDSTPSYLEGSQHLAAISEQGASGATVGGLSTGDTLYLRLQTIRGTSLGRFVVAETSVARSTVP